MKTDAITAPVSLIRTTPPTPPWLGDEISKALKKITGTEDLLTLMRTHKFTGTPEDKETGARWLAQRFGTAPDTDRIIVTNGTQNALFLTLNQVIGSGNVILAEEIGYYGLCKLSGLLGVKVVPVDTDADGADPDAVARLCRKFNPKGLFLAPTLHNPTARVMSLDRRRALADVARRYGLAIVEDDVYGMLPADAPPPMAAIAPDITWHATGPAKCVAPGLRIGYLVTPGKAETAAVFKPVNTTSTWFTSPVSASLMRHLVDNGGGIRILNAIRDEAVERQKLALSILHGAEIRTHPESLFLWLSLPPGCSGDDFVAAAQDRGITIRHGRIFSVNQAYDPKATRIVLGAPETRDELALALKHIAEIIGL